MASCAHWLQWQCGTNIGTAREKVRVARALPALPKISKSFSQGRISYSKVRAMTRVATPKNEEYLLHIAHHGTAAHVEKVVSNYSRGKRLEILFADNNRHAHRALSWYMDGDGMWVFKGRFTAEQGALPASPAGRFRGIADTIRVGNYNNGLEITPKTLPPLWRGEVMDQDLAQLGMQSLE